MSLSTGMRHDAAEIISAAVMVANPYSSVYNALKGKSFPGRVYVVAVGKAASPMARAACDALAGCVTDGIVITKYKHEIGAPETLRVFQAGHPVPDENTVVATRAALEMTAGLSESDTVVFLVSGGGSALFEESLLPLTRLKEITGCLLRSGCDIGEMNSVRKHLSAVKGGRFAEHCAPAKIEAYILSDVVGDATDVIASGPATADKSTCADAIGVIEKYSVIITDEERRILMRETPKTVSGVSEYFVGNLSILCAAAAEKARELGYEAVILTKTLSGEAGERGTELAEKAVALASREHKKTALIMGGETTVTVKGRGKGGRNQEFALSAAKTLSGGEGVCIFACGSDGTDGPTDAAGGIVDGSTVNLLSEAGGDIDAFLADNDSFHALEQCGGLIFTGPTGTNVNDLYVALID